MNRDDEPTIMRDSGTSDSSNPKLGQQLEFV
jgi:hypothetical protein